ncbi:DUF2971 domain-containing protein [Pseudooceanicola atlanticus]|uniref:DUF2971 domain-containing protein n=1 Tax=Pseudooceanicola atlanticus TaxID=1461694 RepID=UPI0009DE8C19|nr:DUF2971 domain-containing protein [Pseudooceanicola atlanticus]
MSQEWLKSEKGRHTLFYFTSATHALSNIYNERVRVSDFASCNDGFELTALNISTPKKREDNRAWRSRIAEKFGLICMSSNWRNPLMWGHYGKRGAGACLVFSVSQDCVSKVKYLSQREPAPEDFNYPDESDLPKLRKFCSQKFSSWSYEREYRFLVDLSRTEKNGADGRFLKMSDEIRLVGVINGYSPESGKKEFVDAFGGRVLNYFQSRLAFTRFRVVEQRQKKYWKP